MFVVRAYEYLVCCFFAMGRHRQPWQPIRQATFERVCFFSFGTACNVLAFPYIILPVFGLVFAYSDSMTVIFLILNFSLNWLAVTRLIGYDRIEARLKLAGVSGAKTMTKHAFFYVAGSFFAPLIFMVLMAVLRQ